MESGRLGQTRYSVLGGNVSDRTGHADQASNGTVIHNCAFSTFEHFRDFIFHAKPDTGQVSCHDAMPILFTRRLNSCDRPNQASVVECEVQPAVLTDRMPIMFCMSAALVTSTGKQVASPPVFLIVATTLSAPETLTSPMMTLAPSRAKARAAARPIPDAPPVITTTLPVIIRDLHNRHTFGTFTRKYPASGCPLKRRLLRSGPTNNTS